MNDRETCPVCDGGAFLEIERRQNIPIAQNLVFHDQPSARNCAVGQLRMLRCRHCGFTWNASFDPALMKYDATYDNDQSFSGAFRSHVSSIAERVVASEPDKERLAVLEIGCGQGAFLSVLDDLLGDRLAGAVGFDPAWRGDADKLSAKIQVIGDYFTPVTASRAGLDADIVVSRHTIEHVPDPVPFLEAIRKSSKPGATVLIETPTVDWILENGMFFDFFYEHCSIFNPHSMAVAMRRAGLLVESVELVFGDQYLFAVGRVPERSSQLDLDTAPSLPPFDDLGYTRYRDDRLTAIRRTIQSAASEGADLALWGGASKGVTVALMLEAEREQIKCAIDINPRKQGCFLPGTGIPILAPEAAHAAGVSFALILNPNYADEIEQYCRDSGIEMMLGTL